jgi:hypothetical protein
MESLGSTTNSIVHDTPLVGSPQNDNTSPFKEKNIGVEPSKQNIPTQATVTQDERKLSGACSMLLNISLMTPTE